MNFGLLFRGAIFFHNGYLAHMLSERDVNTGLLHFISFINMHKGRLTTYILCTPSLHLTPIRCTKFKQRQLSPSIYQLSHLSVTVGICSSKRMFPYSGDVNDAIISSLISRVMTTDRQTDRQTADVWQCHIQSIVVGKSRKKHKNYIHIPIRAVFLNAVNTASC